MGFIRDIYAPMHDAKVKKWSAVKIRDDGKNVYSIPYAKYGADVSFQKSNICSGNHEEAKVYCSGKHRFYGFRCERSDIPSGYSIVFTKHYVE